MTGIFELLTIISLAEGTASLILLFWIVIPRLEEKGEKGK